MLAALSVGEGARMGVSLGSSDELLLYFAFSPTIVADKVKAARAALFFFLSTVGVQEAFRELNI